MLCTPNVRAWGVAAVLLISACDGSRGVELPEADAAVDPDAATGDAGTADPDVTWYRDIVPLVQAQCLSCHRSGGIAPFSMESYQTAAPYARAMAGDVIGGIMPPWPPSEDCQPYLDARRVDDHEKALIVRWADLGAPAGDPADAPPMLPPAALDRVDLEGDPGVEYTPTGADDYRCFVVDLGLTRTQQLVALEIVPGVRWMVHHVVLFQANALEAQAADAVDSGPGWSCFGGPGVAPTSPLDSLAVGAWAPGTPVTHYPAGTGVDLTAGNVIVMQVHYHVTGGRSPEPDRTIVHMQVADAAVTPAYVSSIYNNTFAIPPRDPGGSVLMHSSSVTWPITIPGTLLGVFPHMHLLGRTIHLTYSPPGGATSTCLANVPSWNFHWQQFYFYDLAGGIRLETGGTLELTCEWERPTDGRTIFWGEGSDDEMCIVGLYVVP